MSVAGGIIVQLVGMNGFEAISLMVVSKSNWFMVWSEVVVVVVWMLLLWVSDWWCPRIVMGDQLTSSLSKSVAPSVLSESESGM